MHDKACKNIISLKQWKNKTEFMSKMWVGKVRSLATRGFASVWFFCPVSFDKCCKE